MNIKCDRAMRLKLLPSS